MSAKIVVSLTGHDVEDIQLDALQSNLKYKTINQLFKKHFEQVNNDIQWHLGRTVNIETVTCEMNNWEEGYDVTITLDNAMGVGEYISLLRSKFGYDAQMNIDSVVEARRIDDGDEPVGRVTFGKPETYRNLNDLLCDKPKEVKEVKKPKKTIVQGKNRTIFIIE